MDLSNVIPGKLININQARKLAQQFKSKPGYRIVGQTTSNPARDRKYLAELRDYDDENHRLILKESRERRFDTINEAAFYKGEAWRACMRKLGVKCVDDLHAALARRSLTVAKFGELLDKEMAQRDIHIEERPPKGLNVEKDGWKSGMYVYYHGDIVYFISNPYSLRKMVQNIVVVGQVVYCVRSNAPSLET